MFVRVSGSSFFESTVDDDPLPSGDRDPFQSVPFEQEDHDSDPDSHRETSARVRAPVHDAEKSTTDPLPDSDDPMPDLQSTTEPVHPLALKLHNAFAMGQLEVEDFMSAWLDAVLDFMLHPNSGTFQWPPRIRSFSESVLYHCGESGYNLVRGAGEYGNGRRRSEHKASSFNLPLMAPRTVAADKAAYTSHSGVVYDQAMSFLRAVSSLARPLIRNHQVLLFAITFARDGFILRPGLQWDPRLKQIVGVDATCPPLDLKWVQENSPPNPEFLKKYVALDADETLAFDITGVVALVVATYFRGRASKDSKSVLAEILEIARSLSICLHCLQSCTVQHGVIVDSKCNVTDCKGASTS
jgi:hypothetical protein